MHRCTRAYTHTYIHARRALWTHRENEYACAEPDESVGELHNRAHAHRTSHGTAHTAQCAAMETRAPLALG